MGLQDRLLFIPGRQGIRWSFLLAFAGFYLLNCFAPLRLEYDSVHYFSLKECLENVCPPGFRAAGDPHPMGYPILLWILARLGVLHAFVIAAINAFFLAGSLFFVQKSFPSSLRSGVFFPLVLFQWTVIKFFAYPLSEMQYLFFSAGCIFCFQKYAGGRYAGGKYVEGKYAGGKRMVWLAAAVMAAGLAFFTRSAGGVLAPALLAGSIWQHRQKLKANGVRNILLALAGIVCLVGVLYFSRALRLDLYLNSFKDRNSGIVLMREHFSEWGQLLLNVPGNKVTGLLPGWGKWLLVLAGILLAALFLYALLIRRKEIPPVISVYLIAYSLLIFNWPFYDARFWIPVVPFVAMLVPSLGKPGRGKMWEDGRQRERGGKRVFRMGGILRVVLTVYVVMGLGAAGYSTYTAFNKKALARTQAGGIFRNEYETYFFGRPLSDTATRTDRYVLSILKRYN